jgi:predicted DNA-binding mobile mystery protein A
MEAKHKKLVRTQLDAKFRCFRALKDVSTPEKGWIRVIRDALGMTGEQLAVRLNSTKQRVMRIEQEERLGGVTLKTLRKVAKALNCTFVYGFVPYEGSLEETVRKQAEVMAKRQASRTNQMMRLEDQELSDKEKAKSLKALINDITDSMPKSLWDKK